MRELRARLPLDLVGWHAMFTPAGVRHYTVAGKPHFYDSDAAVVLTQSTLPGGQACATVEATLEQFLRDSLAR